MSDAESGTDQSPLPTDLIEGRRSEIDTRAHKARTISNGQNVPTVMETYLAGYRDAHELISGELMNLKSSMRVFDEKIREQRDPQCARCGSVLGDEWKEANEEAKADGTDPADCPMCEQNPLPRVGGDVDAE